MNSCKSCSKQINEKFYYCYPCNQERLKDKKKCMTCNKYVKDPYDICYSCHNNGYSPQRQTAKDFFSVCRFNMK